MRQRTFRRCQALASPAERILALTISLLLSATIWAQDFSIDWHTIDGGGEVLSETSDQQWQLSGTLGQWDSTASLALSGAGWTLSGGFWPVTVEQTDRLFRDGFED
ncbi:MAG: hypothetical protein LC637_11030 [Xanthomonadaceae bacterium]|nr:hypothetical protein [Xanthomonadaceae bacterium]